MTDDSPKLWFGTPGESDWREVGEVKDFQTSRTVPETDIRDFDPSKPVALSQETISITTTLQSSTLDRLMEAMAGITPAMGQFRRSVMVIGTHAVAHKHPGPWELRLRRGMNEAKAREAGATKRVEHARARKLYSERLRRDRRRLRKGRKPILRTGPSFMAMFLRDRIYGYRPSGYFVDEARKFMNLGDIS